MATRPSATARDSGTLDQKAISSFKSSIRGEILIRGDAGYEKARKVFNGMIDRFPAVIARCVNVADVMASVNFAREHDLALSVRGGGHNVTGFATNDGGLVIDLSPMKGIRIDPDEQVAYIEGGCTWGDVDHATHAFGLATAGGIISTTGVGGLTLGGGVGHLTRRCGLSIDNLISADVVTADGHLVRAGAKENSDLYWALRGGGGNFGVITSFEFRLHPVGTVLAGPILYPLEKGREALKFYRDFMNNAPDNINAFFAYLIVPPGDPFPANLQNKTVCAVVVCCSGDLEKAEKTIKPLRQFGPPLLDMVGALPFPAVQSMFDGLVPSGLQNYWKADFVNDLTDDIIDAHVKYGPGIPTFNSALHIYPVSGAANRVGKGETAYNYRDAKYVHVIAAMYPNPSDTEKNMKWVRDYWESLHPHSSGGAYVNFMMDEGEDRIAATYRDNFSRLALIKRKYDPDNLFRMNQNIKPAK
ncbi:FAD linked oxidase domain protein [Candidatus Zixiibacteriota bacterium]|nr:FAD linked oxidase domain protein [candidate division Zixibacteria bacterium]